VAIAVLVGLILLGACSVGRASTSPTGAAPNAVPSLDDIADIGKKTLTYSVDGSGSATVSYTKSGVGQEQREVTLPWTADVEADFIGSLVTQKKSDNQSPITCRIMNGTKKVTESTSSGAYAIANCSG
jgi:hypothetical protein